MNLEQSKEKDFLMRLQKANMSSWASWFFVGLGILFLIIGCVAPVQAYMQTKDPVDMFMVLMMGFVGPFIGHMRIQPYTMHTENLKARTVFDLVKYYPIDKREIKKIKSVCMTKFMVKLLPFCILAQIPATLYDYGQLSIINFLYIFVVAFLWPVIWNLVTIWAEE